MLEGGIQNLISETRKTDEVLLGVLVHLADGRAGQNVMELIGQNQSPALVKRGARILRPQQDPRTRGVELRRVIQALRQRVPQLLARLSGVRTAVVLEIQLAVPYGNVVSARQ